MQINFDFILIRFVLCYHLKLDHEILVIFKLTGYALVRHSVAFLISFTSFAHSITEIFPTQNEHKQKPRPRLET